MWSKHKRSRINHYYITMLWMRNGGPKSSLSAWTWTQARLPPKSSLFPVQTEGTTSQIQLHKVIMEWPEFSEDLLHWSCLSLLPYILETKTSFFYKEQFCVSCFLALYVILRILIWTTITGIRGTILFLEGSSSCFFFLPCANNKTVWNKKHLKGKKTPQKAPPNSLLYLLFMFCGCSH